MGPWRTEIGTWQVSRTRGQTVKLGRFSFTMHDNNKERKKAFAIFLQGRCAWAVAVFRRILRSLQFCLSPTYWLSDAPIAVLGLHTEPIDYLARASDLASCVHAQRRRAVAVLGIILARPVSLPFFPNWLNPAMLM